VGHPEVDKQQQQAVLVAIGAAVRTDGTLATPSDDHSQ
jgi:hypothetical protein